MERLNLICCLSLVLTLGFLGVLVVCLLERGRIREPEILQRWGVLVDDQAGQRRHFFDLVRESFADHGWPHEVVEKNLKFSSTLSMGTPHLSTREGKFAAYIGAQDSGRDVHLDWTLALSKMGHLQTLWVMLRWIVFPAGGIRRLNAQDTNDARAFSRQVHNCVLEAAYTMVEEARMDRGQVPREPSGTLGRV